MTKETLLSLNTQTLIGNTSQRGTAWHYRAELQGEEPNHYPGPIPAGDVARRLFGWRAQSRPVAVERPADAATMTHLSAAGEPVRWVAVESRQAIVRSDRDDGTVLGVFTQAYEPHQYTEYLLRTVSDILDDSLTISSAGLLRDGAIAWVEVSMPESITTPEGVEFRPNLLATTTHDGSLATTYKRTVTDVVCDNTRAAALAERGRELRIRHSRHSHVKLDAARDALAIVHTTADTFAEEIRRLCQVEVDRRTWSRFLDSWVPLKGPQDQPLPPRAYKIAEQKREAIDALYVGDRRVEPWGGTAHAVLQAVNTYEHHSSPMRGSSRAQRNMLRTVDGTYASLDRAAWASLQRVLPERTAAERALTEEPAGGLVLVGG
jgi:phage/plasmid-like protein (TIGR03299 family)